MTDKIIAYKGFNADLTCRGFQFEVGKTYEHHGEVEACASGFHACTHPLDVFGHYPPAVSRFAIVEISSDTATYGDDSKIAAARITIKAEIQLGEMIEAAVKAVFDGAKLVAGAIAKGRAKHASATGDRGAASATGDRGAASATGSRGAASATGDMGAASATGSRGAASATGDMGAASATGSRGAASATGSRGAASATGYMGAASATGDRGAASATGIRGAASATGYMGAASATGYMGAASATGYMGASSATGDMGAASATGKHSVAIGVGFECRAHAAEGCALFLVERASDGRILNVFSGIAGVGDIEPMVWYRLDDGKLAIAA